MASELRRFEWRRAQAPLLTHTQRRTRQSPIIRRSCSTPLDAQARALIACNFSLALIGVDAGVCVHGGGRYQYIVVGEHYKRPTNPVWVVCCESHFTCLFAADTRALNDRKPFDLFYYDGLANQDEVIRFTVTHSATGGHTARGGDTVGSRGAMEGQLTPPLEFVIETRWPGVHVDWNGTDPIL